MALLSLVLALAFSAMSPSATAQATSFSISNNTNCGFKVIAYFQKNCNYSTSNSDTGLQSLLSQSSYSVTAPSGMVVWQSRIYDLSNNPLSAFTCGAANWSPTHTVGTCGGSGNCGTGVTYQGDGGTSNKIDCY